MTTYLKYLLVLTMFSANFKLFALEGDTIKSSRLMAPLLSYNIENEVIIFQVNAQITYFSFSNFVKNEAKQLFMEAFVKEKEARKLSVQNDSLRKAYINASDEQKEQITQLILSAESKAIKLNGEIPTLYEKTRDIESRYWNSATADEKALFKEKMLAHQDSIRISSSRQKIRYTLPDTITYYKGGKKPADNASTTPAIIYKIQVGAYKGKMPDLAAKAIKKLELLRKVENYKDDKGVTVYTTGSLKTYKEAVTLLNQVKLEGIKNAIIAAYHKGARVTVDEARKLNNEPVESATPQAKPAKAKPVK